MKTDIWKKGNKNTIISRNRNIYHVNIFRKMKIRL